MARRTVLSTGNTVDLTSSNRQVTSDFTRDNREEWWLCYITINFSSTEARDITVYLVDTATGTTYFLDSATSNTSTGFSFSTRADIPIPKGHEVRVEMTQTAGPCEAAVLIVGYSER